MAAATERVVVIACGVMRLDVAAAAARLGLTVETEYLEAGLHEQPGELRRTLQAAVTAASARPEVTRIAIGYGLCGRGLVGVRAGRVPLVVPRVHDCISLFLGSDAAYRKEFRQCPGTFYISAGWYEAKVQPLRQKPPPQPAAVAQAELERLMARYGEENGRAVATFLGSWKRHYRRAVFIDTGTGDRERYIAYTRAMAEECGWEFTIIKSDGDLVDQVLTATASSPTVLWVPPGQVVIHDARENHLAAAPPVSATPAAPPAATSTCARCAPAKSTPDEAQCGWPTACGDCAKCAPGALSARELLATAPAVPTPLAPAAAAPAPGQVRLGLGIDAGGTYTDAALFDFTHRRVLGQGKDLTTRWDYTIGIRGALRPLAAADLARVDLVAVSTTLATNAIVEGAGQRVGLLLMPPYAGPPDLPHQPAAVIPGRLSISGGELAPVDVAAGLAAARAWRTQLGISAIAVSGYAATVNPAHEQALREALVADGFTVVCGHELSSQLDFTVRAHTAVLNARIIPLLARFVADASRVLAELGLRAPLVIVKGDGTLMSAAQARTRPIETVLSGPAASVAGARFLTGLADATVVDVGGTTSDLARVSGGVVEASAEGATVGGWHTHVRALRMRTVGLGGDSVIRYVHGRRTVGPQRVAPVSWLAAAYPGTAAALDWLVAHTGDFHDTQALPLVVAHGRAADDALSPAEHELLALLRERPHSLAELAQRSGWHHWKLLPLERLEAGNYVQRCGLTPTDLLHVRGELALWPGTAAARLLDFYAALAQQPPPAFATGVLDDMRQRLAVELLKVQLPADSNPDALDAQPAAQALLATWLGGNDRALVLNATLRHPIIGLGAPVGFFLPAAAARLQAQVVIPPCADVANAVGAITSHIAVRRELRILPAESGAFLLHGLAGVHEFPTFAAADERARALIQAQVLALARAAGTSHTTVQLDVRDTLAPTADGGEVFLERLLTAQIHGPPDLVAALGASG